MSGTTAQDILDALIVGSDDKIWATELAFLDDGSRADFWTLEPVGDYALCKPGLGVVARSGWGVYRPLQKIGMTYCGGLSQ